MLDPYCLLEKKCILCGKEMGPREEPIVDGAQDISYLCYDCYKPGYVKFFKHPEPHNIYPPVSAAEFLKETLFPRQENEPKQEIIHIVCKECGVSLRVVTVEPTGKRIGDYYLRTWINKTGSVHISGWDGDYEVCEKCWRAML